MPKLILLFSDISNRIDIDPEDIVLSNVNYSSIDPRQLIIVNANDLPLENYRDLLEKAKEDYKKHLGNQLIYDAFISSYNNFYNHIFRSLMKWIYAIDKLLLLNKFNVVVLSDYVDSDLYMPYYEAEGEINKRLFYHVFDFIPNYVKNYLNEKELDVKVVRQHNKSSLVLRIFVRRYVLLMAKFVLALKNHLSYKFNLDKKEYAIPEVDNLFVFLSRGVPHTHYLLPYLQFNQKNTILYVSDGIKSKNKNLKYFNELDIRGWSYLQFCNYSDYFKVFIKIVIALIKTHKLPDISTLSLNLKVKSTIREMLIGYYEVELYRLSLARFVIFLKKRSKAKITLITAEMFTPFAYVTAKVGNIEQIRTLQLQTSLIDYWPQTIFTYCDKFIFTSYQALEFYTKSNPEEAPKYRYWGVLTEVKKEISKKTLIKILYFTQPYENELEFELVKCLKSIVDDIGGELYIKLHPRDPVDKFKLIGDDILFIGTNKVITEYIFKFDLVVVRTSAIGKEAIIAGVPTIIALLSSADQTIKVDFIQSDYKDFKCFVYNYEQLNEAITNYELTLTEFVKFRNSFIKDNRLSQDVYSFHENLTQFSCN